MKITIVYDNYSNREGLKSGWGFSALLEVEHMPPLLFDTGDDGTTLMHNLRQLRVDPNHIGIIVISHAHSDHIGGLLKILEMNKGTEIYVPASAGMRLTQKKVVSVSQPIQISETVFSLGEIQEMEQSLAIKTSKGIVVLVGCSHPGVAKILDVASCYGNVYGIVGGLHSFDEFSRLDDLSLICPCHCTQYKSELKLLFPEKYVDCGVGSILNIKNKRQGNS